MPPAFERGSPRGPHEAPIGGSGGGSSTGFDAASNHEGKELPGNMVVALVTGGERGIGGMSSVNLALNNVNVIAIHRDPTKTKSESETLQRAGEAAESIDLGLFDISRISDRNGLVDHIITKYGGVDIIIQNAPSGMEREVHGAKITEKNKGLLTHYADVVNSGAKVDLMTQLVTRTAEEDRKKAEAEGREYKPRRIKVLDQPSMWSLFYGKTDQIAEYEPVAGPKYVGMNEQREAVDDLNKRGHDVVLGMVCGHGIEGTVTMSMLKALDRRLPDEEKFYAALEATAVGGKLPTVEQMSAAVVGMALSDFENGEIRYVGIPNWNEERIRQEFNPVYGVEAQRGEDAVFLGNEAFIRHRSRQDETRLRRGALTTKSIDIVTEEQKPKGTFELMIRPEDTLGHMAKTAVFRGVDQVEADVQAAETLLGQNLRQDRRLSLKRIVDAKFGRIVVNETAEVNVERTDDKKYKAKAELRKQGGRNASSVQEIEFVIADLLPEGQGEASKTDMIEWVAQGLGLVSLKNRYYPEVPADIAQPTDGDDQGVLELPLFTKFDEALFEEVDTDPNGEFLTRVIMNEQGTGGDGWVYQGDKLVAAVKGVEFRFTPEDRFLSMVQLSQPKPTA